MNSNIRIARIEDLAAINNVVADAAMAWPMAERVKRLSLSTLLYSEVDMVHYEFLVFEESDTILGVAAWDPTGPVSLADSRLRGALFHGLYVKPNAQGKGIGKQLIAAVAERALERDRDGLLIKAERVAVSYFEALGLARIPRCREADYPYQFWLPLSALDASSLRC